ncbi:hypothetical protein JXB31_00750 [Candidatus Woesearchaeota archaeon]|nr:hypothetical protein [Candidatus Woesearchaeota archaeon]
MGDGDFNCNVSMNMFSSEPADAQEDKKRFESPISDEEADKDCKITLYDIDSQPNKIPARKARIEEFKSNVPLRITSSQESSGHIIEVYERETNSKRFLCWLSGIFDKKKGRF